MHDKPNKELSLGQVFEDEEETLADCEYEDEDFSSDTDRNCERNKIIEFFAENPSFERLDSIVSSKCGITRSAAASLINDGCVFVSDKAAVKSRRPKDGEPIKILMPEPKECDAKPQNIPIEIIYEDEYLLVVNKPRGMVVHPAPGNYDGTLVNALLYHCQGKLSGINGVIRPGIVHRIDKDTSGLLIVAKTDEAHVFLASQIKEHSFSRIYNAIVYGVIKEDEGTVDLPIGRNPNDRKKMAVTDKNSKKAVTHYKVLERYKGYTMLELRLETGRTHQIRVHMSHIGHAVLGDPLYAPNGGKNPFGLSGQCLHAKTIGFIHPASREYMEFMSENPKYFTDIIEKLRKGQN